MSELLTEKKIVCCHCGEDCDNHRIFIGENFFCCNGCKFVYELLKDNNLDSYYSIEDKPGIKISTKLYDKHFAYLDNEKIKENLLDFSDGETEKVSLLIPQIHCSSCIWLLENLNRLNKDILFSRVNFLTKEISITYKSANLSLRSLIELLASIGYEPKISLDDYEVKPQKKTESSVLLRLVIAGFCFANIMLFSFPEYLATDGLMRDDFRKFFGYLNLLLSLPVMFFSAVIYFKSAGFALRQKMINMDLPISIGILILFARSLYEVIAGVGPGYFDSLTGLIFFLLIGKIFQQRTYDSLSFDRDYKSYFPISIMRLQDGDEEIVPISDLKKDDLILVRNNELIPADARLLSDHALIDYSFVTGESQPISKNKNDKIYAGGRQTNGMIQLHVLKNVSQSDITQLWHDNTFKDQSKKTLVNLANRFSKYFTFSILSIALFAGLAWLFIDPSKAIFVATAVLIIACPCALALSTPFTLGTAQRILGRNTFYLKNSQTVESLASIDNIVFDKTGTLTKTNATSIEFIGKKLDRLEESSIYSITRQSTHPMSQKISSLLKCDKNIEVTDFNEISGAGLSGRIKNIDIKIGSANYCHVLKSEQRSSADESRVYLSIDNSFRGYFKIKNEYRHGLETLASQIESTHTISLLSGDNNSELKRLQKIFPRAASYNFNQSPQDKLQFIQKLQESGNTVLMFGDGLNDAGALRQADIGIAVTEDVSSFSPASDGILDADNFMKISQFIRFSEIALKIILFSFGISILYNIIGLSFAVTGHLSPLLAAVLMPLSSITVVLFTTITTKIMAKRIGL